MRFNSAFSFLAVAAVAEEAAIPHAPQETAHAVLDASQCDIHIVPFKTQLTAAKASFDVCNKELTDARDLQTKKETEHLTKTTQSTVEINQLKTKISQLEKESGACSKEEQKKHLDALAKVEADIKSAEQKAQAAIDKNAQLVTQVAKHDNETNALKKELDALKTTSTELNKAQQEKAESEKKLMEALKTVKALEKSKSELIEEKARHEVHVRKLQGELKEFTTTVYSASQFNRMLSQLKVIGGAFVRVTHNKIIGAMGQDNYDLVIDFVSLQTKVWVGKARDLSKIHIEPLLAKAAEQYNLQLKSTVDVVIFNLRQVMVKPYELMISGYEGALAYVERYMERMVANLSKVSPSVRELFPESFQDRCYAFAFLLVSGQLASNLVQSIFGAITSVLGFLLFGSSKKSTSSSGKSTKTLRKVRKEVVEVRGFAKELNAKASQLVDQAHIANVRAIGAKNGAGKAGVVQKVMDTADAAETVYQQAATIARMASELYSRSVGVCKVAESEGHATSSEKNLSEKMKA